MPISPAYNLATYRAQLLFLLESHFRRSSSPSWSDSQILMYINDAIRQVYLRLNWLKGSPASSVALTSGTNRYKLPSGRIGVGVNTITLTVNGSTTPPLTQRDYTYQQSLAANSQLGQSPQVFDTPGTLLGVPTDYYLDPSDQTYLIFIQTPNVSGTINFVFQPTQPSLTRMWDQAAITASITSGSPTVTLSGSAVLEKVSIGDQWGTYFTTQLDSSTPAPTNPMPLEWYTIENIADTVITLSENYTGITNPTANFITSQVPLFELAFPGMLGMDICDLACASALRLNDNRLSAQLAQDAWSRIELFSPMLQNFNSGLPIPALYLFNFYWR